MYLFCYTMEGISNYHGAKALVGKNLWELKTADGKLLMQGFAALIKSNAEGWVDYKWPQPQTKGVIEKDAYIVWLRRLLGLAVLGVKIGS